MSERNLTLDCPVYGNTSEALIDSFKFWVEGVAQTCIAVPGFIGNVMFCFILTRKELINGFNLLLVGLAAFDSCYIFGAVMESIRTSFKLSTNFHIMLFPYLLYPGQMMALTGSIFMIVAIAFERYIAVHNPLDYKKAMNDVSALRHRLFKYIIPVIIASFIFNIPKFFEATYFAVEKPGPDGMNITTLRLNVTSLRISPAYSIYVNWSQSLILGFLPAILLIYFNTKIYLDVRERAKRRKPWTHNHRSTYHQSRLHSEVFSECIELTRYGAHPREAALIEDGGSIVNDDDDSRVRNGNGVPLLSPGGDDNSSVTSPTERVRLAVASPNISPPGVVAGGAVISSNVRRRKAEDKMAIIFIAIVTGFLVTNIPRLLLDLHEIVVFENALACGKAGFHTFSVWSRILNCFSHLLLVINSSMNILFYGFFNQQFRIEARRVLFSS